MYVAMTRPRNHLAVSYPLNVYATRRAADYSIDQLSRFIDRGVRAQMRRVTLEETGPVIPREAMEASPSGLDLRELLRGRFGAKRDQ